MQIKSLLICFTLIALAACGKKEESVNAAESADSAQVSSVANTKQKTEKSAAQLGSLANSQTDSERKFIRHADAKFQVKDVYQSALAIEDITAQMGGFVERNSIQSRKERIEHEKIGDDKLLQLTQYVLDGELVLRVPSAKTQEFLRLIAAQIAFLDERTFTAKDAQFDLLRQKMGIHLNQQTQQQLGEAAEQSKNQRTKAEIIVAQNDSTMARDEAIVREKEFNDQVAFSSISLHLYQLPQLSKTELPNIESAFAQSRPSFFTRLWASIQTGWQGGLNSIVFLSQAWPLWLLLLALLIGLKRYRAIRRARAAKEPISS
ncbi:DUF4349 domain-containing protein [Iodobacter sp.]|uniref:DUF4349 domain-containing protein n=1 Tax=Iodobacter sp. TaxID=1915058 RepID=UPI0025EC2A5B|nr:DUF4349 domain-containing protein [Iodobacter sp.]